jgi:hypothetical protein
MSEILTEYSTINEVNLALSNGELNLEEARQIVCDSFSSYVYAEDSEEFIYGDDAFFCEAAQLYYSSDDDFIEVIESLRYGSVSSSRNVLSDNDSDYFCCERSGLNFDNNKFNCYAVDGEDICYEYYSDDLYYWESDGEYHWDVEEEESNIPDYHDCDRPKSWNDSKGYGLELEVWVDWPENVHDQLPDEFFGEKDGSICDVHGIEIIAPPMPIQSFYDGNDWENVMKLINRNGGDVPSTGYGLHVNISNSLFDGNLHRAKFIVAINKLEKIGQLVARREKIYHGKYHQDKKVNKNTRYTDKCEPVNAKSHCLEVRIFKSTTSYNDIVAAIEYCEAVKEFTRTCSIVDLGEVEKIEKILFREIKKGNKFRNVKKMLEEKIVLH